MADLREICDKIEEETADLRGKATAKPWADFTRRAFIYNLVNIVPGMDELHTLFVEAEKEISRSGEAEKLGIEEHVAELEKHIQILKRNKAMEESRMEKLRHHSSEIADTVAVPELYSDLEQKTLASLLRSNYLIERIRIHDRKKDPITLAKAGQRNVLDLLQKREEELSDLKKKYEETRKNSFLGMAERDSSIEIERELNELSRKLDSRTALMKRNFELLRETTEKYNNQVVELEGRINGVEELGAQLTGKTFELITMLKKERDYVKKVLIEIEQDTIQLRNTYSKELINLQEEKIGIRNSTEERYEKQLKELRHNLREKTELLNSFREMAHNKERKIGQMEEEMDKLRLVAKVVDRHEKAKKAFSEKKTPRKRMKQ